jgi:hypothetical protein
VDHWEKLLSAERNIQRIVPGSVLVGGTAAALHARHRVSLDADHVLPDLRDRFDQVLRDLEAAAGWRTNRVQSPVLILGQLNGMLTGIRQLRRVRPLETVVIEGLRVPTLAEMLRIKLWLLATRNTVRDYLDSVVLMELAGPTGTPEAVKEFDAIYPQPTGTSPLSEAIERLASGLPSDLAAVDLAQYRELQAPWNSWAYLMQRGRYWAAILAAGLLGDEG